MRGLLLLSFCIALSELSLAQRYVSQESRISFFSDGIIEDILAVNGKANSVFDSSSGEIVFAVPINQFQFEKALMQEHFNDKYMESDRYPRATFRGVLSGYTVGEREQEVVAEGRLLIHGVEKMVSIPGTVRSSGNSLIMHSEFSIRVADYDITIPRVVWQNIAEVVDVTVEFTYTPYED